jgi:hypothetical protein
VCTVRRQTTWCSLPCLPPAPLCNDDPVPRRRVTWAFFFFEKLNKELILRGTLLLAQIFLIESRVLVVVAVLYWTCPIPVSRGEVVTRSRVG